MGNDHDQEMMVESIMSQRQWNGEQTEYTTPERDQKWRARDLLDIHWNLTGIKCPESFNRIMSCIVGHVNVNTGACFPKQSTIAFETGVSRKTVRRAVEWWEEHKFLKTEGRGLARALAYHPQFKLFDRYWRNVTEDIAVQKEAAKMSHACPPLVSHACPPLVSHGEGQYGVPHNLKEETSKENLKEESLQELVHPPSASDTHVISSSEGKKEEGIQGEQVEGTESQHAPPAEPIVPEPDFVEVVEDALSRHPLYLELLGWSGLGLELMMDAAAAERDEAGAGVVLVVERFVAAQKEVGT